MIDVIKNRMKEKSISQAELAANTGFEKAYVSKFLAGNVKNPTIATLTKFVDALGLKLRDLFPPETPEIAGYIDVSGQVHRITSLGDVENLLKDIKK